MLATSKVQTFYLNKELLPYLLIYSFSPLLIENFDASDNYDFIDLDVDSYVLSLDTSESYLGDVSRFGQMTNKLINKMKEVKVYAPATVANVACGYDILGFAIDKPGDEIIGRLSDKPGLRITKITGDNGKLPYSIEKNCAGYAAQKVLEQLGETGRGIEIEIHKKMPFSSGMGSSSASSVAGAMIVNELLERPLSKEELLHAAVLGEQIADGAYHADNVAPSLFGGLIFIRDNATLDVHRIPTPSGLYATVIHPQIQIRTEDARAILSDQNSLTQTIEQTGNIAGLIVGLYNSDLDLIGRSLKDVIIEPQRAQLIPNFYAVKEAALNEGVLGCSISGAGPSIFALSTDRKIAERAGAAMQKVFFDKGISNSLFVSTINNDGAIRM